MNALFQLQTEIDLQNTKFPTKQWFVWSLNTQLLFLRQRVDLCKFGSNISRVINMTAIEKKNIVQKCPLLSHQWRGPWIIYHVFLSLRRKCHMQVKYKYISSGQPAYNVFGFHREGNGATC